jgi:hypothetical protein
MKTEKVKCDHCANAWRVVADEETGTTRLHGCTKPRKQKFSSWAKWVDAPCKDFVDYANVSDHRTREPKANEGSVCRMVRN